MVLFLIFGREDSSSAKKKTPKKPDISSSISPNKNNSGDDDDDEDDSEQIIKDVFKAFDDADKDDIYDCFYVDDEQFEKEAEKIYELSLSTSEYTEISCDEIEFDSTDFTDDKWVSDFEKTVGEDVEKAYSVKAEVPMVQTLNNESYDVVETYDIYTVKVDGEWYIGYMKSIDTQYQKADGQTGSNGTNGTTGITGTSSAIMDFSCIGQPFEGNRKGDSKFGYVNVPDDFKEETDETSVSYTSTVNTRNCFAVFCLEDAGNVTTDQFVEQLKLEIQSDCDEMNVEKADYVCDGSYYIDASVNSQNAEVEMYVLKDPNTSNIYWIALTYEKDNVQQRDYMRSILASYNLYE